MRNLINTLIEIERLKRLDRTGWTLRGLPNGTESVAAHSFGTCVTAMLLADELMSRGVVVDVEKVLRMSIMHDWSEVRLGDMPKIGKDYVPNEAMKIAERRAFVDVVSHSRRAKIYTNLFDEYEQRDSLEARLVKVGDILDLLVEALALEKSGAKGLEEFWDVAKQSQFKFESTVQVVVSSLFESLLDARKEIH